jgi:hypothetical protein
MNGMKMVEFYRRISGHHLGDPGSDPLIGDIEHKIFQLTLKFLFCLPFGSIFKTGKSTRLGVSEDKRR